MKKVNFRLLAMFFAAFALVVTMTSCDDDDDDNGNGDNGNDTGNVIVKQNITENTTWSNDNIYQLAGRIAVEDGATLTIQPGTIIKGELGAGANATALLVARGGKLLAEGTPEAPIIFTSVGDEITLADVAEGNFGSPNLEPDANGLWGGVLILGKAPISASNDAGDVNEIQIEGIPTSDQNGLYGGNQSDDNSGVIKYVSIRHGGANIGSGNEINGLSLGGVGNGTTVENIEIVANQDDGVEWFGGTVNVKNVLTWNVGDDGLDTDQSWAGTVDNFITIAPTGHAFELDGPEGSMEAGHTIKNGSVITTDSEFGRTTEDLINVDDNSIVDLENIFFTGIVEGQQINNVTAAGVTFTNIMLDVPEDNLSDHVNGDVPQGVSAGGSSQTNTSAFSGWTWAAQAGAYSDL